MLTMVKIVVGSENLDARDFSFYYHFLNYCTGQTHSSDGHIRHIDRPEEGECPFARQLNRNDLADIGAAHRLEARQAAATISWIL